MHDRSFLNCASEQLSLNLASGELPYYTCFSTYSLFFSFLIEHNSVPVLIVVVRPQISPSPSCAMQFDPNDSHQTSFER